ncbi:monofunctional biosynthetic peptidoglycan transglycosylase [Rheinheimera riviphila]|uniref:Biosynthetic peptidoglycan transglycosylase n=1 Tax=Rheinheimera riviphila TaxID=1834037 RepID=A0A437QSE1_9GAMM|nr:monofunctional biosynthetic peptidoglycan transglycosylase [Rheinheimera riviphila]RVU37404.1 monofunctional biosynthetic peptidoglycan transglycosylase [Rheinheimera riviphila]
MSQILSTLLRKLLQLLRYGSALVLGLVLLYSFVPVPYTGMMLERQLEAWWSGKSNYQLRHQWVPLEEMSRHLLQAAVASEDQKFLEHNGFDMQAIEKALVYNSKGKKIRGASTISQQTAKNVFLWSGRSWLRKGLETGFTLLIEAVWGKQRILEIYLNSIEFGPGVFGVEAAAQQYFRRSAAQLTAAQAALMVTVLPNPHRFLLQRPSPYMYKRQQWVQKQMRQLAPVTRAFGD